VLYGIKVRNRILIYFIDILDFIYVGESNGGYNTDKYNCSFAKMIQSWRQTWNERTNGITDIQFPFGFVQVSLREIVKNFIFTSIID
jgi:hypothetical protein